MQSVQLRPEWLELLSDEFQQSYMSELAAFLRVQKAQGKVIFPPGNQLFAALEAIPPAEVKVVILGQDPYHGPGQAHGLSFSVLPGVPVPPSLRNIFKELERDLGITPSEIGDLRSWARQGVLLLNAVLSVESGKAGSHQGRGWERFTDRIISLMSEEQRPKVFMLWGSQAQRKGAHIDRDRHHVLTAPHPSPLSAHRGFLGCGHFSAANDFLVAKQRGAIDWGSVAQSGK